MSASEPAFPSRIKHEYEEIDMEIRHPGMTLRDYFAIRVLEAMISNPDWMNNPNGDKNFRMDIAVKDAYKTADAMLEQREGDGGE